jgi:PAS domain-containing protein
LSGEQTKPPVWSAGNLRLAIEAAGVALWSWNVDNDKLTMDESGYLLWGVPISEFVAFEDLSAHIHPADRDRVRAAFSATRGISGSVGEPTEWIYRPRLVSGGGDYHCSHEQTAPRRLTERRNSA